MPRVVVTLAQVRAAQAMVRRGVTRPAVVKIANARPVRR